MGVKRRGGPEIRRELELRRESEMSRGLRPERTLEVEERLGRRIESREWMFKQMFGTVDHLVTSA